MRRAAAILFLTLVPATGRAVDWQRCRVGPLEARCTTIDVAERRDRPDGRRLALSVVLLPATEEPALDDPIVILEGGPGASVTHFAMLHAQTFARARRHRPLVLVDQRGTGRSASLACGAMDSFRELATMDSVGACRDELSPRADLAYYTTEDVVADLAEIFARTGFERVNLFATSYGTRTALRFVHDHPERVRTMTLLAPYPTTHNVLVEAGPVMDRGLRMLAEACAVDASCSASYEHLDETIVALPRRFGAAPQWSRFAAGVRMMLFFPLQAARVPQLLDLVNRSTALPPPSPGPQADLLAGWISEGAFLSILCAEDASRTDVEAVRRASTGTFLGPGWGESLVRSCRQWPRRDLPAGFDRPVRADVPALLLVGDLDPAMPPSWAYEAAATLTDARVVEVPEGQHSFIGMSGTGCVLGLIDEFVSGASPATLDTSCVGSMRRPTFATAAVTGPPN